MNPNDGNQSGGAPNPQPTVDQKTAAANVLRSQINALYGDQPVAQPQTLSSQSINAQRAARSARLASTQPLTRQQPQAHQAPLQAPQQPYQAQQPQQPQQPQQASQPQLQPTYAQANPKAAQAQQSIETDNPYDRTHTRNPKPQAEQWKTYHSAWQNYYQKYYESYYTQQEKAKQLNTQPASSGSGVLEKTLSQNQANEQPGAADPNEISQDQALKELRQKLLGKVQTRAKNIRRSKHFVPIAASLAVVLVFMFLQYNRVLLATVNAYVSPGAIDPQNIVVKPNSETEISQDPRLIIPKINVDVPTIYGIGPDHNSQMKAMEGGVAHFAIPGANSRPGEIGNTVLSGHSSNDLFDGGDYKFIFAQLDKLSIGDTIYANYEGVRYTYIITQKEVVKPTEVSKLVYPTDKPIMTLITCTPLGTSLNRLLVTAEQISPSPSAAQAAPEGSGQVPEGNESAMPGNSPTLLERLFGAK